MIYTLTLSPALDYVLYTDKISTSDINRSKDERIYYGGKGINVSVLLTRLGLNNIALGFAAGFTGRELLRLLSEDDIKNDFIMLDKGNTRINVKIRSGEELDINANGAQPDENDLKRLTEKLGGLLDDGDTLVLAGSVPASLSYYVYERIIESLQDKKIRFVVDTTGKALLETLKYKPFVIKPNHHELGELFGMQLLDDDEIIKYAKKLKAMGAVNVLVSRAERGAILLDETGRVHKIENAKGRLVNSVGCGDSMLAGFIAGYEEKGDYEYALKLATACANATAFSASLAKKEDIIKYMQ